MQAVTDTIELLTYTKVRDDIGVEQEEEHARKAYCTRKSISQSEYYKAHDARLSIKHCFVLNEWDYSGEEYIRYRGEKLKVQRTYAVNGTIEVYAGA